MTDSGPHVEAEVRQEQHFVPAFYLRRFAGPTNLVQVFDGKFRKIIRPRGTSGICKERFFYAIDTGQADEASQIVEHEFARIENMVAARIRPIVEDLLSGKHVGDEAKWEIAYLMAMIWARGPAMRLQINSLQEQVLKFTFETIGVDALVDSTDRRMGRNTSPEMRKSMQELVDSGQYSVSFSNEAHLKFLDDLPNWANLFHAQYWNVYINRTEETFVTSDNPVVVVIPERKDFYGPTFLERTHYFALSPEICIQAVHPDHDSGKKLRRTTLFPDGQETVSHLNRVLAHQARRYVYARDRQPLEAILRFVGARTGR